MITFKYQNPPDAEVQQTMFELSCLEYPQCVRIQDVTLRRVKFSHKVESRRTWKITISCDHPDNDLAFMKEFWSAELMWITDPSATAFIQVVPKDGGAFPVEFIDGLIDLPEVTFELEAKYPQ